MPNLNLKDNQSYSDDKVCKCGHANQEHIEDSFTDNIISHGFCLGDNCTCKCEGFELKVDL